MSEQDSAERIVAWLWERPDGTRAAVIEHASEPHWELRITRRGRVIECERCRSFSDLIAASTAAHVKADRTN
ncbi:MAG TPA: hypothetical protein VNG89_14320 [Vicinamibacterales bacterium]|nr:hypothetical protein [Vicinamibacterales bacterium]